MSEVIAFGVDTANGPRRDAVWKDDYDAVVAELAEARKPLEAYLEFWTNRRIAALEAALLKIDLLGFGPCSMIVRGVMATTETK